MQFTKCFIYLHFEYQSCDSKSAVGFWVSDSLKRSSGHLTGICHYLVPGRRDRAILPRGIAITVTLILAQRWCLCVLSSSWKFIRCLRAFVSWLSTYNFVLLVAMLWRHASLTTNRSSKQDACACNKKLFPGYCRETNQQV